VPAQCRFATLVRTVLVLHCLLSGWQFAWLAFLVVGFAAISTRGRWSLLGARLPCLLGDWVRRQFGWWAAVPA
jgi:hypothetical protein